MKNLSHKIYIAADHGGFDLKEKIKLSFPEYTWVDFGTKNGETSVDYPDFANELCLALKNAPESERGILICGSGQGMAMRANKFPWIRAGLVWSLDSTELARKHNNANVLCLGGRLLPHNLAVECVKVFLNTPFDGGRHTPRVDKLKAEIDK